jgi:hypothetical protein
MNMAYVRPNFRTKTDLKKALKEGRTVQVFQPNELFPNSVPKDGVVFLEGPHYPEPHRWYAQGMMKEGRLVTIK